MPGDDELTVSDSVETATSDGRTERWWRTADWRVVGPRLALAVVGVAALVVGLKAAWTVNAAAPALIVAAVLLALAFVFTPDLAELSGRFRDAEFKYARRESAAQAGTLAEVEEAMRVALRVEGGDGDLRRAIEELASEAGRAASLRAMDAERRTEERRSAVLRYLTRPLRDEPSDPGTFWTTLAIPRPVATHVREEGSNAITLTLKNPPIGPLSCTVAGPDGRSDTQVVFRLAPDAEGVGLAYPQSFGKGAKPLVPGSYEVAWRDHRSQTGLSAPVIATDTFEIPEQGGAAS